MSDRGFASRLNFLRKRGMPVPQRLAEEHGFSNPHAERLDRSASHPDLDAIKARFSRAWTEVGFAVVRVAASQGKLPALRNQAADKLIHPTRDLRSIADDYSAFVNAFECTEHAHVRELTDAREGVKAIDEHIRTIEAIGSYDPDGRLGNAIADIVVILSHINTTNKTFAERLNGHR